MTTVTVNFWDLVLLLIAFLAFVFAAGKVLLSQIDRRLNERFESMEKARKESSEHWDKSFAAVLDKLQQESSAWNQLERDFMNFKADLPLSYVRREDYIRGQTVIEAKLDALHSEIRVVQIKGGING